MIGVVLAGGKSSRFGGEKLLYKINGKPLILHTIERVLNAKKIEEIAIVTSREKMKSFEKLGFSVVVDKLKIGPIGGVYTAISNFADVFVVAGDMPLVNPKFVDWIVEKFHESNAPVCVPKWKNGYLEPLHATYSQDFLEMIKRQIEKGEYMLGKAIRASSPCYIKIESLPLEWQESLFNINAKSDLKKIKGLSRV